MLLDVLTRLTTDTSLDSVDDRTRLVDLLNRGAKEMYARLECNKIYWERTVIVPRNKIITLPSYIGELRGMRTSISEMTFDIYGMSNPRYVKKTWDYRWMNWRDMGESAVMQLPSVVGPLSISCTPETTPVTLNISGQTGAATRLEEKVLLNQPLLRTTNLFGPAIYSISCVAPGRTNDITISDSNGVILAVLANCDNKTRFKMIDVSQFGWPQDGATDDTTSYIDVLYKVPLRALTQDTDSFPAGDDYDIAWYYAAMWQYYIPDATKAQQMSGFKQQMLEALAAVKEGGENELMKKLEFGRNKYMDGVRNSTSVEDLYQGSGKPNGWPYFGAWDTW